MIKVFIYLFLVFSVFLNAKEDTQLQIVAKKIITTNNIINASGNVLIFSPNYYITAKKAIYNKTEQRLELYDNVNISKNNEAISLSDYASIDMQHEVNKASPVLLLDKKSDVWIDANKITKIKDYNQITNATLSSCDCYNPAWSLGFAKGDFNTTSQWVNTYNNTLYIKDIPAWYFLLPFAPYVASEHLLVSYLLVNPPYVGFSTSNQRESGLLKPNVGYATSQGYIYEQPIYFAPTLNYDFEFIPKFRTKRGNGYEYKYRYKDSFNSKLNLSYGNFREKTEYFKKENLINQEHFGWAFDYTKDKLLSNNNTSDGLIVSLQDMNDIEYKNTLYDAQATSSSKILESKIQYYYNTNSYYADIHLQHYNDISLVNNDSVFQTLPKGSFHQYTNRFLGIDNISSSFDFAFHRKYRREGISANISDFLLPISYNKYFFNDYINVSFIEQFKYKYIDYFNHNNTYNNTYKDAYNLSNSHIINMTSDLLKPYDSFIHIIQPSITISKYNNIKTKSLLYGINTQDTNLRSFTSNKSSDHITLSLNQNFYAKSNKYTVNHQVTQSYFDNDSTIEKANLESELKLTIDTASFLNRTYYNHQDKMIIKSTYDFDYSLDNFSASIDYSFSKDKNKTSDSYVGMPSNKSTTVALSNKIFKYYTIKYKKQYDITNAITQKEEFGFNINEKCWELDLLLSDDLIASATRNKKARRQNTIYATITLKPLISLKQKYVQDEREE
jgi:LPS-assembly protein